MNKNNVGIKSANGGNSNSSQSIGSTKIVVTSNTSTACKVDYVHGMVRLLGYLSTIQFSLVKSNRLPGRNAERIVPHSI